MKVRVVGAAGFGKGGAGQWVRAGVEFSSQDEFKAWLKGQSQEVCVAIACRAALRVWPFVIGSRYWKTGREARAAHKRLALLTGRAMVISGVATVYPTPEIRRAASAVASAVASTSAADADADAADADAAFAAAAFAAADAAYAADAAFAASASASAYAYAAAYADADFPLELILRQPLWHDSGPPDGLRGADIGETLLDTDPTFDFFRRWYEGMVRGEPLDWELQRRVALIDDAVWEAGAEAVAAEIARIEAEWLAEQLPQADKLEFHEETAVFVSRPGPLNAEALVESTLRQVEFAVKVAQSSNCGLNASSTACLYIAFTLADCRSDANAIEQNLEIALRDLEEGVANGSYQEDGKLSALTRVLDRAVTDLRAHHPDVSAAWEMRIRHKLRVAEADQKQVIVEKATELIAISDARLGRELALDAKTIAEAGGEAQGGAVRRFFGRVAQMRIIVRSGEVIKRIDASSGYKGTRIVQTLQSLLDLVVQLF